MRIPQSKAKESACTIAKYISLAHPISREAMEVQSLLVQWPGRYALAQKLLIEALQVTNWTRVNTVIALETMQALRFRATLAPGSILSPSVTLRLRTATTSPSVFLR